jgi:hypothetical protein
MAWSEVRRDEADNPGHDLDLRPNMPRDRDFDRAFFLSSPSSLYLDLCILRDSVSKQRPKRKPKKSSEKPGEEEGREALPAVADHAHALCLGHAIELCAGLQVLLTANALRVAESRFAERIGVAPSCG